MIRVTNIGKTLVVHVRRHDTVEPRFMQIGAEEMSSDRQTRMQFKRAVKMEVSCRKF